jgi:uncharacterized phiE125 gp8 family phage protein
MARLVTLVDVKAYLNIGTTQNDDELTGFLLDAVAAIEDLIGPIAPQSFTDEFDEHGPNIVLPHTPVQSVQSVSIQPWLGAAPVDDTAAWRLNATSGVLRRALIGGSLPFYGRGSIFTVTYTAGRADVPGPVNRAILLQVAEMWRSQRGASPMGPGQQDQAEPSYQGGLGFLDDAVMELLLPYLAPPGAA